MYVKWQRRPRRTMGGSPLLMAVLVESHRVDGKPRQRVVAYLAGIRERFVGEREDKHDKFWRSVDAHLDALGLDAETRARIEASVAKGVARVTTDNRVEFEAAEASIASARASAAADYRRLCGARY